MIRTVVVFWPRFTRWVEYYPALATALGLLMLCVVPGIQYRAWVQKTVDQAIIDADVGRQERDRGDTYLAVDSLNRAKSGLTRPLLGFGVDRHALDEVDLDLAKTELVLARETNNRRSLLSDAANDFAALVVKSDYQLDGLAGLAILRPVISDSPATHAIDGRLQELEVDATRPTPSAATTEFHQKLVDLFLQVYVVDGTFRPVPGLRLNTYILYTVCWQGTMQDRAAQVLPVCEALATVADNSFAYLDAVGIARAVNGRIDDAVEPLERATGIATPADPYAAVRGTWIEALRQGTNPFNRETLDGLRPVLPTVDQ